MWPFVRVESSLALLGGRALHADPLVRAPGPELGGGGIADPLDADTRVLPPGRRVGPGDDLPLAGLVGEAIADLKLHRQDPAGGSGRRLALLLGPRLSHRL